MASPTPGATSPDSPASRFVSAVVLLLLGSLLSYWIGSQFFGPYARLKSRVRTDLGTERVQQWAVKVLDAHGPVTRIVTIDPSEMPDDIRAVLRGGYVVPAEHGEEEHVQITLGWKFHTYGLLIGRSGYVPRRLHDKSEKLADGVWAWEG